PKMINQRSTSYLKNTDMKQSSKNVSLFTILRKQPSGKVPIKCEFCFPFSSISSRVQQLVVHARILCRYSVRKIEQLFFVKFSKQITRFYLARLCLMPEIFYYRGIRLWFFLNL